MAEAAQCQTTYISQVLGGASHLSLEQSQAASQFLGLSHEEAYYFLLLVEKARAGTTALQHFLQDRIKHEQEKYLLIRERIKLDNALNVEAKSIYYSSWHYAAIHMLLTIPEFQTSVQIVKRMKLPQQRVNEVLNFLVSVGLAKQQAEKYLPGASQIYLEKHSSLISKHHTNWRMRAIESLDWNRSEDIHFSSVFTLTEDVAQKVRRLLVKGIEEAVSLVKEAKEEKIVAMTLDFFDI